MTDDPSKAPDLAAVISSRICHDLVSPVGAIVNGVDLIREIGPGGLDSEFSMISQSADRASELLQFYRIAFGAAPADAEDISRAMLHERARSLVETPRVTLDWDGVEGPPLSRLEARLLCQLLLCARAITGMRAAVSVQLPEFETFPVVISVAGERTTGAEDRLRLLDQGIAEIELSPRVVEFAVAGSSAQEIGVQLSVDLEPGVTVISATQD